MEQINFHIIIVIYNSLINISQYSFFKKENARIYFADNSTDNEIKTKNKNINFNSSFLYIDMNGNVGLSKAYNSIISKISKKNNNWILLADQDTEFPSNILTIYEEYIKKNPLKLVFAPVISDKIGILSPSLIKGKNVIHSNGYSNYDDFKKITFINSGLCINSKIFENLQYDENLFLDLVDFDFINTCKKQFGYDIFFVIKQIEIFQHFSGVEKNSFVSDYNRFKIYCKDQNYFYKKHYNANFYSIFRLLLRALKLSLMHKNFRFFNCLRKIK